MKDEQINIIIAKEIGTHKVRKERFEEGERFEVEDKNGVVCVFRFFDDGLGTQSEPLPWISFENYCNNLEAMIKAEKWLMNIDPQSWDEYYCSFEKGLCGSTTRQRAENFVKILGKWEE